MKHNNLNTINRPLFRESWLVIRCTLLIGMMISFLQGCKQTKEIVYQPSRVEVEVLNDKQVALQGVLVKMFDLEENYEKAKNGDANALPIESEVTDSKGKVIFENLNTKKTYFFLVTYRDRANFVDLDNFSSEYKLSEFLGEGTFNYVKINLKPAKSVVSFYADTKLEKHLPIKLIIGDDTIGDISSTVASVPNSPAVQGPIAFKLSQGKRTWYAKSALGCIWYGDISVSGTESFTPLALEACYAGAVSFYVDSTNADKLPIDIRLDNGDEIGTLVKTLTSQPTACFQPGTISAARDTGEVSYIAESKRGGCVWTGKVKIGLDCKVIKLTKCN